EDVRLDPVRRTERRQGCIGERELLVRGRREWAGGVLGVEDGPCGQIERDRGGPGRSHVWDAQRPGEPLLERRLGGPGGGRGRAEGGQGEEEGGETAGHAESIFRA